MTVYKNICILLVSFLLLGFTEKSNDKQALAVTQDSVEIPVYNFESLEPLLYTNSDKIHVVNFWAMWCAPCVKELPIFQEYEKNHADVELTLVSLDFPEDIEQKLIPFLKKRNIVSTVVLLDDPNANSWIDKIDPNWSGAIPFTIIFNKEKRSYHERTFKDITDLENTINQLYNK
ncbi:TlpA family protein disulfide reductase [Nonlabens sp.]|uniref:TlpA family protein disulfide reductase n=1 Tax=Nonlabens sp. TaxID=1888209 RepID=UPI003262F9BD